MAEASNEERTFEPTEQRREQFRKDGRYAKSKDLAGIAATIAAGAVLVASRGALLRAVEVLFARTTGDLLALDRLGTTAALHGATGPCFVELVTVLVAAAVAALGTACAQTRFRLNSGAIGFKLERLDPKAGLSRIFSFKKNGIELLLSLTRAGGAAAIAVWMVSKELPELLRTSRIHAFAGATIAASSLGRILGATLVMLGAFAAIDYAVSYFTLEREMKMTRKERMDEAKNEDGDPKVKARMKQRARALAKRRAIASVKNADVIVTNPTHIAVALRYGPKDVAPIVVAKGHDEVALRIRSEGRKRGIPILENRPLARVLDAQVPVGRPIPQAHFAAVAQVLAFVYRLKRRGALAGGDR